MPKTVIKVSHKPRLAQQKKVAASARVSTGKDAMLHSLSSQVKGGADVFLDLNCMIIEC